ncbi:MAG: chromosomal replication initiator protein DnaA [Bacteroidetes bacterium]|nr:chromosomal replication initiator protein DnaA [Bacteroidota bacterium]
MERPLERSWLQQKDELASTIPAQQFQTWLQPVQFVSCTDAGNAVHVTLSVPSEFHRDWVDREYGSFIQTTVEKSAGKGASYSFIIARDQVVEAVHESASRSYKANSAELSDNASKGPRQSSAELNRYKPSSAQGDNFRGGQPSRKESGPTPPFTIRAETLPGALPRTLNPKYTFDSFIEADCNRLARSAGVAVSNRPGETSFNPFLIYGKVGLGKTHLAHAIGNHIVGQHPRAQVLYLTSEAFTNCFVHAIQNNTLVEFTHSFRQIDVLIVDDIQFFGGKEKTQEQFFHLFNDLHQRGKQIILCADRSPAEIAGIEERLLSRFRWGLSADVQPPDLETRTAILRKHALDNGLDLSGEVIDYIAYNVKDNIRLLEGAFNRLLATQQITKRPIDLIFVQEALQDQIDNRTRKSISASQIRDIVAEYYTMSPDLLIGKSRKRPIVDARQVAMHFCKLMTQHSLEAIGRRFGGRDHSTVIHACKAIQARIDTDPRFVEDLGRIDQILKNRVLHS